MLKDVDDPNLKILCEEMNFKTGMKQLVDHDQEVWCKYTLNDLEPRKKLHSCKRNAALESKPEWYCKTFLLYHDKLGKKKIISISTGEYYRNLLHMADLSANSA